MDVRSDDPGIVGYSSSSRAVFSSDDDGEGSVVDASAVVWVAGGDGEEGMSGLVGEFSSLARISSMSWRTMVFVTAVVVVADEEGGWSGGAGSSMGSPSPPCWSALVPASGEGGRAWGESPNSTRASFSKRRIHPKVPVGRRRVM